MSGEKIDETLADLNHEALYRLAEYHDKQATLCRARAYKLQHRAAQSVKIDAQLEFYKTLPRTVARYLKQGHDIDRAIALAAAHTDTPEATVKSWWKKFITNREKTAVQQRNALAYEMSCLGVSNVAIGQRLGLHEVTVSRVLKAERKKRLVQHNQERLALYPAHRAVAQENARRSTMQHADFKG